MTRIKRQKQYHPSIPPFSAWGTTASWASEISQAKTEPNIQKMSDKVTTHK